MDFPSSPRFPTESLTRVLSGWKRAGRLLAGYRARPYNPIWLPARLQHPLIGYGAAVLLPALALLLSTWLSVVFPTLSIHSAFELLMVALVAFLFGVGQSLIAVLVSVGVFWFLVLPVKGSWWLSSVDDLVSLVLLAAVGLSLSLLASLNELARREAIAATEARDTFLSIAAHELRTPLTVTKASVQLAQRRIGRTVAVADKCEPAVVAEVEAIVPHLARA